jgi:curli biogenesis system outer membrane secretion channel CsgG
MIKSGSDSDPSSVARCAVLSDYLKTAYTSEDNQTLTKGIGVADSTTTTLRKGSSFLAAGIVALLATGCATQTPPITQHEAPASVNEQKAAQQAVLEKAPVAPALKRKIALGRITNETRYGQSLLRDNHGDPLGKQVTDLMSKALTESGAFLVFERPDISRLQNESALTGTQLNLVGVDALVIGSLTEFGRKTIGERGFLSDSKRQVAFAKVDIRVVDVSTGHAFFATSGAGEASTETASTLGFGSRASYDGTLNDAAIRQAVSEAVSRLSAEMEGRPWETYILRVDGEALYIGGGKSQGVKPGMEFAIYTQGEKVKSTQTGAEIILPGRKLAELRVEANFGDTELSEGSVGTLISGSLQNYKPERLVVRFEGEAQ